MVPQNFSTFALGVSAANTDPFSYNPSAPAWSRQADNGHERIGSSAANSSWLLAGNSLAVSWSWLPLALPLSQKARVEGGKSIMGRILSAIEFAPAIQIYIYPFKDSGLRCKFISLVLFHLSFPPTSLSLLGDAPTLS